MDEAEDLTSTQVIGQRDLNVDLILMFTQGSGR